MRNLMANVLKKGLVFMLAIALSFGTLYSSAWAGNYSQTCDRVRLENAELKAVCRKRNQIPMDTSLNLDEDIDNTNGVLRFGGQNFSQTCSGINLQGEATLKAVCDDRQGFPKDTELNLDEGISNIDGSLRFD